MLDGTVLSPKIYNFREWSVGGWLSYVFGNRKNASGDHKVMSLDRVTEVKQLDSGTGWWGWSPPTPPHTQGRTCDRGPAPDHVQSFAGCLLSIPGAQGGRIRQVFSWISSLSGCPSTRDRGVCFKDVLECRRNEGRPITR